MSARHLKEFYLDKVVPDASYNEQEGAILAQAVEFLWDNGHTLAGNLLEKEMIAVVNNRVRFMVMWKNREDWI